jgi:serine/threonine-protein kinase HipA
MWKDKLVGYLLYNDSTNNLRFVYDENWVFAGCPPISASLPISLEPYDSFKTTACANFFTNLMPEGFNYEYLCQQRKITPGDITGFFRALGRDCAGAIWFVSHKRLSHPFKCNYEDVTKNLISAIMRHKNTPLFIPFTGCQQIFSGIQNKIAVIIKDRKIYVPSHDSVAPTSHIIKAAGKKYPNLILNQYFCMTLAKRMHIPVPNFQLIYLAQEPFLAIERYDRDFSNDSVIYHHQEDFCQALGLPFTAKGANTGFGVIDCISLIQKLDFENYARSKLEIIRVILFNLLIGNSFASSKDFSILYYFDDNNVFKIKLAPFHSLYCTSVYPFVSKTMSMHIGNNYLRSIFTYNDVIKFVTDCKITIARFKYILLELMDSFNAVYPDLFKEHKKEFKMDDFYDELNRQMSIGMRILASSFSKVSKNVDETGQNQTRK